MAFHNQLVGRQGHGHVHHAEVPLHPGAAVEPQVALLHPVVVLDDFEGAQYGLHAGTVRSVRVGQVAGGVDLVGLHLAQQLDDDVDVLLGELALLDTARLVEREVEEVGVCVGIQAERAYGGAGFGAADRTLQVEQGARFGLALLLAGDDLADLVHMVAVTQFARGIDVLQHDVVVYGHVARGLIGHMHVVSLLYEADERSAHRDHVVIGVGREDHHAFREGRRGHGARRVVGVGLAARPARNRVLHVPDDRYHRHSVCHPAIR